MNWRALCFLQTVLLSRSEGVIQSRSATSKQTDDEPGSWGALKIGGVVAVLRPAAPSSPHQPPQVHCKQGLERGAGNTLLMEGVWQRVKVIAALFPAAELILLVCGQFQSKRTHLLQSFQPAVFYMTSLCSAVTSDRTCVMSKKARKSYENMSVICPRSLNGGWQQFRS